MQLGSTTLVELDAMLDIQLNQIQDDVTDDYMRGMYNGIEFARSLLTNTEPVFVSQDGTLDPEAKERCPERYI